MPTKALLILLNYSDIFINSSGQKFHLSQMFLVAISKLQAGYLTGPLGRLDTVHIN